MRIGFYIFLSALLAASLTGCSGDDGMGGFNPGTGDLIIEGMIGNWSASSAMFTTVNANPVQSRDVVADGGFCDLSVSQIHSFVLVVRNPGSQDAQITTGQLVADGEFINVRFDTDPDVDVRWDFTISGDDLSIAGPMDYDFEDDEIFEETSANMQFERN